MATTRKAPAPKPKVRQPLWRTILVSLLVTLGVVSAIGFTMAHWVERQVLTTDNWVEVVAPLPKDDKVATALSAYTVNQLFTNLDIQDKIQQALPDKASFLAAPLADQLQTRLTKRTKQVIQSDQFIAVWTLANRTASERLIASARGEQTSQPKAAALLNLNLSSLRGTVANILGRDSSVQPASGKKVGVVVNLKTSLNRLKEYIRLVDFANATLWMAALACLLGALVLTFQRRRLLIVISSLFVVVSLLQIAGVKALQPYVLNQIHNASYRPAVSVIYDTLLASFRNASVTLLISSIVVFVLAFVLHKPLLQRNKFTKSWLAELEKSRFNQQLQVARAYTRQYRYQIMAAVAVLTLAIVAFFVDLNARSSVRSALLIVVLAEIVSLFATRKANTAK